MGLPAHAPLRLTPLTPASQAKVEQALKDSGLL